MKNRRRIDREQYVLPAIGSRMQEIQKVDGTGITEKEYMALVEEILNNYKMEQEVAEANRKEEEIKKQVADFMTEIALERKKEGELVVLPETYAPKDPYRWVAFSVRHVYYSNSFNDNMEFPICPTILSTRVHDDKWKITGVATKVDYGHCIEIRYFRATHPLLGEVYGDVQQYIVASNQLAYDVFFDAHPFSTFYQKKGSP